MRTSAFFTVGLLALLAQARAWTADNFPNPMNPKDTAKCNRGDVLGWVCDPDKLVSQKHLNTVEGTIRAIYNAEQPFNQDKCEDSEDGLASWQVAVAVLKKVDGHGNAAAKVERFAQRLHARLGVGDKACGTGALLVVSVEDRQVYISSGRDALKQLRPSQVEDIIARMAPELKQHKYGEALVVGVTYMGMYLSREGGNSDSGSRWTIAAVFGAIAGVFGISHWRTRRQRNAHQSAGRRLQQMQKDLQEANAGRYLSTTCPICLDDFEPKASSPAAVPQDAAPEASETTNLLGVKARSTDADKSLADALPVAVGTTDGPSAPAPEAHEPSRVPGAAKVPFLLPCGHTFCEPCILEWLKSHAACPVCRKPADGSDESGAGPSSRPPLDRPPPPDARDRGGNSPGDRFGRGNWGGRNWGRGNSCQYLDRPYLGRDLYLAEFAFRMMQMRNRYPTVITDTMVQDMNHQAANGQELTWAQHADYQARDPAVQAERSRQGASSSGSHNFGGGHSAGGSGGGW